MKDVRPDQRGAVFAAASATIQVATAPPEDVAGGLGITFAVATAPIGGAIVVALRGWERTAGGKASG